MLRLMSFLGVILIIELILFGPLGLTVFDISIRKVLVAALIGASIVPILSQRPMVIWQINLFLGAIVFLAIWGGVVPLVNNIDLRMTVAEVQPLVALLLILPFYQLIRYDGAEYYLKIIRRCSAALGVIVILIWVASNILGRVDIGLAMRQFYIGMNDSETGVYIGPMPDGTFRVMLINFILFPIMLCYYNWKKTNFAWSAFYMVAIFATGTRAFLLAGALILGVSLIRKRPLLGISAAVAVALAALIYVGDLQRLRVFELSSELTSTSARYLQFFSLTELFWEHPIFGAGFGASAVVIRSIESPYSYELTYVALLAKLGIVGSAIIVLLLANWLFRLMRRSPDWPSMLALVSSIILMTASNPYLINMVGLAIVAFIIALGSQTSDAFAHERRAILVTDRRSMGA
jgi:hypothetical protein